MDMQLLLLSLTFCTPASVTINSIRIFTNGNHTTSNKLARGLITWLMEKYEPHSVQVLSFLSSVTGSDAAL